MSPPDCGGTASAPSLGPGATDPLLDLLDESLQIIWQRHAVDVGDVRGAELYQRTSVATHGSIQAHQAAGAFVDADAPLVTEVFSAQT